MHWSPPQLIRIAFGSLVAGYLLWPPGNVYWTAVADAIGTAATMGIVFLLAFLFGAGVLRWPDISLATFGLGGSVAYVVGMVLIDVLVAPESPVHYVLYAGLLVCALLGGVASKRIPTE